MEITYASRQIEKICTDEKKAKKELGQIGAEVLAERLHQLRTAKSLEELRFRPGKWHELTGDRWGQLAVSLKGLERLIFEPDHDPRPIKDDGGLDWAAVTVVCILEITDYH